MSTITITLPDDRLKKVKEVADHLGVTPEELVRASVEDFLAQPEAEFEKALMYVLKKNAELYKRLA